MSDNVTFAALLKLAAEEERKATVKPLFKSEDDIEWTNTVPTLVEGLIPAIGTGLLYSAPEAGKSPIALDLAFAVAERGYWLGAKVNFPGDVVYIPMEGIEALGRYRAGYRRLHGPRPGRPAGRVFFHVYNDPELDRVGPLVEPWLNDNGKRIGWLENGLKKITEAVWAQEIRPRLVILDTQIDFMDAEMDENSSNDIKRLYEAADKMAQELRCIVLFVHHSTKSSAEGWPDYRGSSGMGGKIVVSMALKVDGKTRGAGQLRFEKRKGLAGSSKPVYPYFPSEGERPEDGFMITWTPEGKNLSLAEAAEMYATDHPQEITKANTKDAVREVLSGWSKSMQRANNPTSGWSRNELRNELKFRADQGEDVYCSNKGLDPILAEMTQEGIIRDAKPDDGSSSEWQLI